MRLFFRCSGEKPKCRHCESFNIECVYKVNTGFSQDVEPQAAKRRASSPLQDDQRSRASLFRELSYQAISAYDEPDRPSSVHESSHQLHRSGSNASMAGSVHSDVSEYNQQGLLTRRTITTTNSYVADTGLASPCAMLSSDNDGGRVKSSPVSQQSSARKQSKWSPDEDATIIQLRGEGMKWEDISKHLAGRSAISCRLHYQNYLEQRSEWDEDRKNKLARLYERYVLCRALYQDLSYHNFT